MAITIIQNDKAYQYTPSSAAPRKPHNSAMDEVVAYVDAIAQGGSPLLYGTIFVDIDMTSGSSVTLRHRLGRPFLGYICIRNKGTQFSALEAVLPTTIASSTNAAPIVITTSSNHNLSSGDRVQVSGHLVNTSANGSWAITVTGATTFSLNGSVGVGVGGATGNIQMIDVDFSEKLILRSNVTGKFSIWVF